MTTRFGLGLSAVILLLVALVLMIGFIRNLRSGAAKPALYYFVGLTFVFPAVVLVFERGAELFGQPGHSIPAGTMFALIKVMIFAPAVAAFLVFLLIGLAQLVQRQRKTEAMLNLRRVVAVLLFIIAQGIWTTVLPRLLA